jgi:hypothetical protein
MSQFLDDCLVKRVVQLRTLSARSSETACVAPSKAARAVRLTLIEIRSDCPLFSESTNLYFAAPVLKSLTDDLAPERSTRTERDLNIVQDPRTIDFVFLDFSSI